MDRIEAFKKFIELYGQKAQLEVTQEECAELIQAISKYFRGKEGAREKIIGELADVKIMVEQLIYMFNCDPEVEDLINFKIDRQMRRYNLERGEKND